MQIQSAKHPRAVLPHHIPVKLNDPAVAPAAICTNAGTDTKEESEARAIDTPPAGAGLFNATEHDTVKVCQISG